MAIMIYNDSLEADYKTGYYKHASKDYQKKARTRAAIERQYKLEPVYIRDSNEEAARRVVRVLLSPLAWYDKRVYLPCDIREGFLRPAFDALDAGHVSFNYLYALVLSLFREKERREKQASAQRRAAFIAKYGTGADALKKYESDPDPVSIEYEDFEDDYDEIFNN